MLCHTIPIMLLMSTHNSHKLLKNTLSECTKRDYSTMVIIQKHNGGLNVVLESTFLVVVERVCYIHIPLYHSIHEAC